MRIVERFNTAWNILIKGRASLQEANTDSDKDMSSFRKLSSSKRDLTPWKHKQAVDMSHYLYQKNPLGRRFIDIPRDYTAGTDFNLTVKIYKVNKITGEREDTGRQDAQTLWDEFYTDPINKLDKEKQVYVSNLLVNGELIIPVSVNEENGFVRIGYYDPSYIADIVLDEKNARIVRAIKMNDQYTFGDKTISVINWDMDPESKTYGKLIGDAFYFRINYLLGQNRGYPELLEAADWIDGVDQFIWNNLEGSVYRNSFFLQEMRTGLTEDELKKLPIEAMPASGTKKITNEKVEYKMITPDLKANDVSETLKMYKGLVLAGKGYPEHWFSQGGDTNRATAWAQNEPAIVSLKAKQQVIKFMFIDIAKFVMDMAILKGVLKIADTESEKEVIDYQVLMANLDKKEIETMSGSFNQMLQGLLVAVDSGWISNDNAKRIVDNLISQIGIDVDESESVEDIKAQQEEDDIDGLPSTDKIKEIMVDEEYYKQKKE